MPSVIGVWITPGCTELSRIPDQAGEGGLLHGSVSPACVAHAHCPVLVTNDSSQSRAAVTWAARRAADVGVPLMILYVVDDRRVVEPTSWIGMLLDTGDELLETAAGRVKGTVPVEVTTKILEGGVAGSLGKYSTKVSMLVVGSGAAHLGGSLTDRALQVAAAAKCPVAVIGNQTIGGQRGVVVGVDGSEESTQALSESISGLSEDYPGLVVQSPGNRYGTGGGSGASGS